MMMCGAEVISQSFLLARLDLDGPGTGPPLHMQICMAWGHGIFMDAGTKDTIVSLMAVMTIYIFGGRCGM